MRASRIQNDRVMEEGQTTTPSAANEPVEGASSGTDADDAESQPGRSFLTRLFQRASSALTSDSEADARLRAELGPAFRDSTLAEMAMVMNILRLREQRVIDVMIPRADIVAVAQDAPLADVIAAFEHGSLSRLPVYRDTLDDPIGFVHLKDIALTYGVGSGRAAKEFSLTEHIRKALFVPPSMNIAALLQRMQAARVHMALVIDEFGGVDGLVTIEDLVEQIVGDIEDEHDSAELDQWSEEAPGIYAINARADLREFEEAEGVHLLLEDWEEDIDTFGGLVFMLTGRVPARGEVIAHPDGYEFEITDADPRRVKRLRMTLNGARDGTRIGQTAAAREAAE
jgi:magnesium and cobalt transporter